MFSRNPGLAAAALLSLHAAIASSAQIDVTHAHRWIPNGFAPPPGRVEAFIVTRFTASEPVTLAEPDSTVTPISPTEYECVFPWNWSAAKSVRFVTASGETLAVQAAPEPRWALDPARHAPPLLHVRTDSTALWDPEIGIYVWGNHNNFVQQGADWERPAVLDYYGTDDLPAFSEPVGLRIHGQASRYLSQKSLRFYFDDYGAGDDLVYDVFGSPPTTFRRLVVRQARRPIFAINHVFANGIFRDLGHLTTRDRACVVYLNGEYWGLYTLSERYDDEFIESTHALADDDYILVKDGEIEHGDIDEWWNLLDSFGSVEDPTTHAWFAGVEQRLDLASYIDWLLINIYCATADNGFDRNVATLRLGDGPWRVLMWDEEAC